MADPFILKAKGITKSFGGVKALDGIDMEVRENSITAVIGPNGSGKTTFVNCINGIYVPDKGRIYFRQKNITRSKTHKLARMGIGRTFQISRVFKKMTVLENLLVPVLRSGKSMEMLAEEAESILDRVGMLELKNSLGEDLSGGQQKLIELSRLFMSDSELVLLDEPFAGVHPKLKTMFYETIKELQETGKTFLLISHDMKSVYRLSDEIVVFDLGKVIAKGKEDEIKVNDRVIEAYLG